MNTEPWKQVAELLTRAMAISKKLPSHGTWRGYAIDHMDGESALDDLIVSAEGEAEFLNARPSA